MTQRQDEIYDYLLMTGDWVSNEILANRFYGVSNESTKRRIREDIEAIRMSDKPKVVVSCEKGYKIGTLEEARDFYALLLFKHAKGMAMANALKKKLGNDGALFINENGEIQVKKAYLEV